MSGAALRIALIAVLWAAAVLDVMKPGYLVFYNPLQPEQPKPKFDVPFLPFI